LALLGVALAYLALASIAAAAKASTYDMRGEWSYVLTCTCTFPDSPTPHSLSGTAIVRKMEFASGAYSGTTTLAVLAGTVSGTVEGEAKLSMELDFSSSPVGPFSFTMTAATLEAASNEVSGSGYYGSGGPEFPTGTLTGVRSLTLPQVEEREAREALERTREQAKKEKEQEEQTKEREEAEAREKVEQGEETKAKEAREQTEHAELQATENARREAVEYLEQLNREDAEKEAAERAGPAGPYNPVASASVAPSAAGLSDKTVIDRSGWVSVDLANANGSPISGEVALSGTSGTRARSAIGSGSFTIASYAEEAVRIKLSKSAAAQIRRHRTLRVLATVTTRGEGQTAAIVKDYTVTVQAPAPKHR
jgi:hypothetical protein